MNNILYIILWLLTILHKFIYIIIINIFSFIITIITIIINSSLLKNIYTYNYYYY